MGHSSGEMTMFAVSRGNDGTELRPLEPWAVQEFLAHLGRGREIKVIR